MKRIRVAGVILSLVLSIIFSFAQDNPDNSLPAPTGAFQVGITFRQWIDENREELLTIDNTDDKRVLSAWIFYPADIEANAEPMPYILDEAFIPMIQVFIEEFKGDPDVVFPILSEWQSYVYLDAAISTAETSYPVILITEPSGVPLASLQAAELASHGYIVIELLHTYNHLFDGNLEWLMELALNDNIALLSILETVNASDSADSLAGKMDLEHIGIMGGSIGGGIARETARQDKRIAAGISQDGTYNQFIPRIIEQPFMYFYASEFTFNGDDAYEKSNSPSYKINFVSFGHDTFYDFIFWPEVEEHYSVASTSGTNARAHAVYTTYTLAFFNQYLKNEPQTLLDGLSEDFSEAEALETLNTD